MKTFLFMFMAMCVAIFFSYVVGVRVGRVQCNAHTARANAAHQSEIIKLQEKINAETFNIGLRDIRRILREKYTIAE